MLNYVRHDEEFHCCIKLKDGTELIGVAMVTMDEELQQRVVYLQQPVQINIITTDKGEGKAIRGMGFSRWMSYSDEDFFILSEDSILTMASLGNEMTAMYEMFLIGEAEDRIKNADIYQDTIPTKDLQGSLGTIEEARKRFEHLFKK